MSNQNDQFFGINYLSFFVSTAGEKGEFAMMIAISKVKVHATWFQNENYKWNKTCTTFSMTSFKFSWTFFQLSLSIFILRLPRFTFPNLFEFVFHNSAWNSLRVIYLYALKSVKIFEQRTNWKNTHFS